MKNESLMKTLFCTIFPPRCVACGCLTGGPYLCDKCAGIEKITIKVCDRCGLTENVCDCKRNAFHFDGVAAPLYNSGHARDAVYRMKFKGSAAAADYLAGQMAQRVREHFKDISFDAVCAVPMFWRGRLRRGYNQSELLACRIAKLLNARYCPRTLSKVCRNRVQHQLKYDERFANTSGVYKANHRLDGRAVLLVDDIRTSGATLNECARVLKRKGASSVIAAVAAVSQNYIEKTYRN